MQYGLDADLLLDQYAEGEGAHPHARHRAIGDVDRIRAVLLRDPRAVEHLGRAEATRGIDFDADHKLPRFDSLQQLGRFRRFFINGPYAAPGELTRTIGSGVNSSLRCGAPTAASSAMRIAWIWAGVVPQQPPISAAP